MKDLIQVTLEPMSYGFRRWQARECKMKKLFQFLKDDAGVTSIEYALISGTTALVLVAALPGLEAALSGQYTAIAGAM